MDVQMVDIDLLIEDPDNARKHDTKNLNAIKGSIKKFHQVEPLIVRSKDNVVIGGNGRLSAMKDLGYKEVAVHYVDLTDKKAKALALALNRTAELAEWDKNILGKELQDLLEHDFDLGEIGFDFSDLEDFEIEPKLSVKEIEEKESEDFSDEPLDDIPEEIKSITKDGGCYEVGNAKLHVGDSLEVLKTLKANSIDSLVTDPPAGISFMGKDWDDDKGGRKEWIGWLSSVMSEAMRVLKPGAHGLVWAIPRTSHWTATALEEAGFEIRDVVTHIFGSGFPKSLNISKAIDKAAGAEREVIGVDKNGCNPNYKCSSADSKNIDITKPSTPEAKQWDGWGTATKPAVEMWLLVAKPFTTVPLDDIISHINAILREIVCQQLHAKYVAKISTSNLKDLKAEKSDFAQWLAVVLSTQKSEGLSDKMDMFKSQETAETCLNIALLWSGILTALLNLKNKYTTKMEKDLITELKILSLSISPIMQACTTKEKTKLSGGKLDVMNAEKCLVSALLRLKGLMEISVPENVSTLAENLKSPIVESQNYDPAIAKDVLSEHYILIRKPLSEKTVAANVLKWGTGGINIDECRIGSEDDFSKIKSQGTKVSLMAGGSFKDGFNDNEHPSIIQAQEKLKNMGRFPANLTLDQEAAQMLDGQSGGASRFFYVAKPSTSERNAGLPEKKRLDFKRNGKETFPSEVGDDWKLVNSNFHPTVKPIKLMSYFVKLVTPPNGVVLDCFNGSGTTGLASITNNFKYVGIEKETQYADITLARWKAYTDG